MDSTRLGISGHSMGTWASWSTAAAYAGAVGAQGEDIAPRAVVLQCGELFTEDAYDPGSTYFNNVLLLTAKYDEFNYFRDFQNTVSDVLLDTPLRLGFLGVEDGARWNTTYGDFSDGSARRCELIRTNHRLTTHDGHAISAAMDWFGCSSGKMPNTVGPLPLIIALIAPWESISCLIVSITGCIISTMDVYIDSPTPIKRKTCSSAYQFSTLGVDG